MQIPDWIHNKDKILFKWMNFIFKVLIFSHFEFDACSMFQTWNILRTNEHVRTQICEHIHPIVGDNITVLVTEDERWACGVEGTTDLSKLAFSSLFTVLWTKTLLHHALIRTRWVLCGSLWIMSTYRTGTWAANFVLLNLLILFVQYNRKYAKHKHKLWPDMSLVLRVLSQSPRLALV